MNYHDKKIQQTLCATYRTTGQLFWPFIGSSAVYIMISTTGDRTSDHRMQSRNSTTCYILTPRPGLKMLFQGDTPEGSDTFQRPVIERDRVGGLRLMIWDKVKVSLCHYSHAPEESNLWTAWQLFPLDDD